MQSIVLLCHLNPTSCNTIVSADNAIVSTDNAIVLTDNAIVSTHNAIAASACKNRKTLFPPAPSKNCGLNDKSLTGHDITAYPAHKTRLPRPRLAPNVKMGVKSLQF
ncbi:MAG: hypothetical protein KME55_04930 [Nostoc indistinguendum CM1-VF10]|nr:hypothetical protein [Nostoc indistinguendum CM1-VF10]